MIVRVSAHRNRQSDKLDAPSTLDSVQQLTLLPRDALNLSFVVRHWQLRIQPYCQLGSIQRNILSLRRALI